MENLAPAPAGRLYSPVQIGLAALLGGPAAAGWLIARDEAQLGRPANGRWWLWGSLLGTILLVVISYLLPPSFPRTGLGIGCTAALYSVARQLYGNTVRDRRAGGEPLGSWWKVVGISLLFMIFTLAVIIGVGVLLPAPAGDPSP